MRPFWAVNWYKCSVIPSLSRDQTRSRLYRKLVTLAETPGKIEPRGIHGFDERGFLLAPPAFQLLFSGNGFVCGRINFKVDEAVEIVAQAKLGGSFLGVLPESSCQTVGHPDVEDIGGVGKNVDVVLPHRLPRPTRV